MRYLFGCDTAAISGVHQVSRHRLEWPVLLQHEQRPSANQHRCAALLCQRLEDRRIHRRRILDRSGNRPENRSVCVAVLRRRWPHGRRHCGGARCTIGRLPPPPPWGSRKDRAPPPPPPRTLTAPPPPPKPPPPPNQRPRATPSNMRAAGAPSVRP